MNLRQQIVSDRVENVAKTLDLKSDRAFLRFTHSLLTGISIHAFEGGDLVDGGQDKQIDTVTVVQDDEEGTLYIISAKFVESFESNIVIQIRNGLDWIFNKSRADIKTLKNTAFADKILEVRSLLSGIGPSNVDVRVIYVTNAESVKGISDECKQEEKTISDTYDNGTFSSFDFRFVSADELVDEINAQEKSSKKVDADIPIKYDANNHR